MNEKFFAKIYARGFVLFRLFSLTTQDRQSRSIWSHILQLSTSLTCYAWQSDQGVTKASLYNWILRKVDVLRSCGWVLAPLCGRIFKIRGATAGRVWSDGGSGAPPSTIHTFDWYLVFPIHCLPWSNICDRPISCNRQVIESTWGVLLNGTLRHILKLIYPILEPFAFCLLWLSALYVGRFLQMHALLFFVFMLICILLWEIPSRK